MTTDIYRCEKCDYDLTEDVRDLKKRLFEKEAETLKLLQRIAEEPPIWTIMVVCPRCGRENVFSKLLSAVM